MCVFIHSYLYNIYMCIHICIYLYIYMYIYIGFTQKIEALQAGLEASQALKAAEAVRAFIYMYIYI